MFYRTVIEGKSGSRAGNKNGPLSRAIEKKKNDANDQKNYINICRIWTYFSYESKAQIKKSSRTLIELNFYRIPDAQHC